MIVQTIFDISTVAQLTKPFFHRFGDLAFKTCIPRSVKVSEAPSFGMPVVTYAPTNKGALAYKALAKEVVKRAKS